jgi:hypothetical protein
MIHSFDGVIDILEEIKEYIDEMAAERSYCEHTKGILTGFNEYEQSTFERLQQKVNDAIDEVVEMSETC